MKNQSNADLDRLVGLAHDALECVLQWPSPTGASTEMRIERLAFTVGQAEAYLTELADGLLRFQKYLDENLPDWRKIG